MEDRETILERKQASLGREPPARIPEHALIARIGSGSYGEVWLARHSLGAYRAVKVVRRSDFAEARPYEREFRGIQKFEPVSRRHEGLIHVLFVGQDAEAGCFYYIMELADDLVTGARIEPDRYTACTLATVMDGRKRLPVEECVALGLRLTSALQFLHESGLTHRDIKPSNIIFIDHQPKLADIGLVTDLGDARSYVGTEDFIPPEGPGTVQADIYSLGKVLYEMSTGKDRHEYPALPERLAEPEEEDDFLEFNELILRACRAGPAQRYASAQEMHRDLLMLKDGRSLRRFRAVERRLGVARRLGLATGVIAALALAGSLYARHQVLIAHQISERETWLRRQAESGRRAAQEHQHRADVEATKSRKMADLLRDMLLAIGPETAAGRDPSLVEAILDRTTARLDRELSGLPEVEVQLRETLGLAFRGIGRFEKAEAMFRRALDLARGVHGLESLPVAGLLGCLANLATDNQDPTTYAEAETMCREALAISNRILGEDNEMSSEHYIILGDLLARQKRADAAETALRRAWTIRRQLFGDEHFATVGAFDAVAAAAEQCGRVEEAEALFGEVLRLRREIMAQDPNLEKSLDVAHTLMHLAVIAQNQCRLTEAEPLFDEALDLRTRLLGEHPVVAESLAGLATLLREEGKLAEAEDVLRKELGMRAKFSTRDHPEQRVCLQNLASVLSEQGKHDQAEQLHAPPPPASR